MANKALDEFIGRLDSHLECWKQFNHFMNLARAKKYTLDDENQFLEVKSIIVQDLEMILATIQDGPVSREEVHTLLASAPSIRYLSETNDNVLRDLESKWHKQYLDLQALLGQLKVKQGKGADKGFWNALMGKPE